MQQTQQMPNLRCRSAQMPRRPIQIHLHCAERELIMVGKSPSQTALCIRINSHVNSSLVLGKFVAINVIGSLNPFHMPVGKHYVASRLAVIVLITWILIVRPALKANLQLAVTAHHYGATIVIQKSQMFAGPATCPRKPKASL